MPKFGDYTASTAPNAGDLLLIKDVVSNSTKKITRSNLLVGTALPNNTVTTAAITDDSVTSAKIQDGRIYKRKGGDATQWNTQGTTDYSVDTLRSVIQVGSGAASSSPDSTITFPTAFAATPIVVGTANSTNAANVYVVCHTVTTTNFKVRAFDAGGQKTAESFNWIAIGVI